MKIGQKLYRVFVDTETGTCEMETWIVRTIRSNQATAVYKSQHTWVKKSSRNGDWGWAPKIHSVWRVAWNLTQPLPNDLATTQRRAWNIALNTARRYKSGRNFWEPGIPDKVEQTASRMIKRNRHNQGPAPQKGTDE